MPNKADGSRADDERWMRQALALARRGFGSTSPNPMVGAVVVRAGRLLGAGWHRRAGRPHAEIEALAAVRKAGLDPRGATLYVTLEPCCTHGRTPPCTEAVVAAGIRRVVVAATDPNPAHSGRAFSWLRERGLRVDVGILAEEATRLNEAFNHWIVHRTPWVVVKAAMTLDGKIATASGESRWITGPAARAVGMRLRRGADAILVGVNTVLADDPSLTLRGGRPKPPGRGLRRILLDSRARTPVGARVVRENADGLTTVVVTERAPRSRREALAGRARVWVAPADPRGGVDLAWLLAELGREQVTSLLVEGGGEVNAAFLFGGFARRIEFFYAPKVLGGREARRAVAGEGAAGRADALALRDPVWRRVGEDAWLSARLAD